MHKKLNSMPKKVVSIFMALFIIILSASFAFAAEPITLTEANVVEWPTFEGEMYYGQKLSEGSLTIVGGTVTTDGTANGTVIDGHFEFIDTDYRPTSTAEGASLRFVPKDSETYSGFEVNRCLDAIFNILPTTPVLVDEINDSPVATKVSAAGKRLMTSTISGGAIMNPYTKEIISNNTWGWEKRTTAVSASGFYTAKTSVGGVYKQISMDIWVGIEGDDTQPVYPAVISEMPTIAESTYNPASTLTYKDLFSGGKAVIRGTDTEISGTFALTEKYANMKPLPTHKKVEAIFTPADTTIASFVQFEIPVTVNSAPLSFKDSEGNTVVDGFTFEVEPNEKMSNIQSLIQGSLIVPEGSIIKVEDYYGYAVNGKTYKLTVEHENNYYEGANEVNELYFTVKFKETELDSVRFFSIGEGKWKVDCGTYSLPGVFTVYAILGETETKIGEVKSNQTLEWMPSSSGDYTFRVEYTPAEDDYFIVNKVTTYSLKHQPNRYFTATGSETTPFHMGETVKVVAPATDPAMAEKPYYGFVGWTVVSGNPDISDEQLASAEVSFAMPDENVELKANYKFSHELYFKWIWQQIVEAFQFVISAFKELFGLAFVV